MSLTSKAIAFNQLINAGKYKEATPLALEILPSLESDGENDHDCLDEASCSIIYLVAEKEGQPVTIEQFEFCLALMNRAWEMPNKSFAGHLQDVTRCFCGSYIEFLPVNESISFRERQIAKSDEFEKCYYLRDMVLYLTETKHYVLAMERIEQLMSLDKSEALLFKSHILKNRPDNNIYEALMTEIQSVKCFDPKLMSFTSYGEYFNSMIGASPLFKASKNNSMPLIIPERVLWYLANIDDEHQIQNAIKTLKEMGAFQFVVSDYSHHLVR